MHNEKKSKDLFLVNGKLKYKILISNFWNIKCLYTMYFKVSIKFKDFSSFWMGEV